MQMYYNTILLAISRKKCKKSGKTSIKRKKNYYLQINIFKHPSDHVIADTTRFSTRKISLKLSNAPEKCIFMHFSMVRV